MRRNIGTTFRRGEGRAAFDCNGSHPYLMNMDGTPYSTDILALSSTLRNERLDAPDGTARKVSKLCGSEVEVDVTLKGDAVSDVAMRVQACALGQASAAILKSAIQGATLEDIRSARDALKAMLKDDGPPPKGRFGKLAALEAVRNYPARHQSTLLAFEAAVEAVEAALAKA